MHLEIHVPYWTRFEVNWKLETLRKKPCALRTPAVTSRVDARPTFSQSLCVPSRKTLTLGFASSSSTAYFNSVYRSASVNVDGVGHTEGRSPSPSGSTMTTAFVLPIPAATPSIQAS